ncbi:MAG: hypothetical protein Q9213_003666 [Squamulea squamosa]
MASLRSKSPWENLPSEIWLIIQSAISDLPTLTNLIAAHPPLEKLFLSNYRNQLADVLVNASSLQFSRLVSGIIWLRYGRECGDQFNQQDYEIQLKDETQPWKLPKLRYPLLVLADLAVLHRDIDYWTDAFLSSCCRGPELRMAKLKAKGPPPPVERPSSPTEEYRIRRALWRFFFLCESTYNNHNPYPKLPRRSCVRMIGVKDFLESITLWELEEIECLYLFLEQRYRKLRIRPDDSKEDRDLPRVKDESPVIQRLLLAMGYELYSPSPTNIDQDSLSGQYTLNNLTFYQDVFLRGRQCRSRASEPLTSWSDAPLHVFTPSTGWDYYCRYSVATPGGLADLLWPKCLDRDRGPAKRFQQWGYCIWDSKRLRDWRMLEGPIKGPWKVNRLRWYGCLERRRQCNLQIAISATE